MAHRIMIKELNSSTNLSLEKDIVRKDNEMMI